jgi:hypothetical protein
MHVHAMIECLLSTLRFIGMHLKCIMTVNCFAHKIVTARSLRTGFIVFCVSLSIISALRISVDDRM